MPRNRFLVSRLDLSSTEHAVYHDDVHLPYLHGTSGFGRVASRVSTIIDFAAIEKIG